MNDNLFTAMHQFVVIGKGGIRLTSHRGLLCDHFKFFRPHRLRHEPLEVPAMTQKMFDSLCAYSYSGYLARFAVTPLISNSSHTFRRDTDRVLFEEHAQYLRDLYYAVELVDEKPLMNEIMDEIQDLQAAAYSTLSPKRSRKSTRIRNDSAPYVLEKGASAVDHCSYYMWARTYAYWPAYYNQDFNNDEFCPDYEFVCMKWEAEGQFDPTIIGSRFGDHGCEFHEHDDPGEIGKCGLLINF
ncbi:uncharacterized protein Bfra_000137 [Botrytis fragariae]|uniref:Uncharacterized protein n=1 Tax=Botrytis fragariae TaxID=1964551 RepID=A0A8H6B2S4_9HELO|nr:uncharacterized protein Bfra_000137 [Botrytis fragariae]KAF5877972.1 hypothetical protein Bfra_000137 [Botrytis fragariae]